MFVACPRGSIEHEGVCFTQESVETMSFAEAEAFCSDMSWFGEGQVTTPFNRKQFYFVNTFLHPSVANETVENMTDAVNLTDEKL